MSVRFISFVYDFRTKDKIVFELTMLENRWTCMI